MDEMETLLLPRVTGGQLDRLLSEGWRHFGPFFFRETEGWNDTVGRRNRIFALRIDVSAFTPNRTWAKLRRRTADLQVSIEPAHLTARHRELFACHITRFTRNVPTAPEDFLGPDPATIPHPIHALSLFRGETLIATGFLDRTPAATSAIYTMWDPAEHAVSPGVLVLLHAIEWTRAQGLSWLYTGYDFEEDSIYAYKHRFSGTQWLDTDGRWKPWPPT